MSLLLLQSSPLRRYGNDSEWLARISSVNVHGDGERAFHYGGTEGGEGFCIIEFLGQGEEGATMIRLGTVLLEGLGEDTP